MLYIVCALQCEANPLIRNLRLKRIEAPFPLFQGAGIVLIISGVGSLAAATAVGFLAGRKHASFSAWLNVGIAGSKAHQLGELVHIHKIVGERRTFYPVPLSSLSCKSTLLISHSCPTSIYPEEGVVDMEGEGFFSGANRFSPAEMIHLLKCISDTPSWSQEKISKQWVEEAIEAHWPKFANAISTLQQLSSKQEEIHTLSSETVALLDRFHWTATEKELLKACMRNHKACRSDLSSLLGTDFKSAKEVLSALASLPTTYSLEN